MNRNPESYIYIYISSVFLVCRQDGKGDAKETRSLHDPCKMGDFSSKTLTGIPRPASGAPVPVKPVPPMKSMASGRRHGSEKGRGLRGVEGNPTCLPVLEGIKQKPGFTGWTPRECKSLKGGGLTGLLLAAASQVAGNLEAVSCSWREGI